MNKKVAIMQPYFFPYIGYFQLINSVDEFVIYDNIQYTKKGWINRNNILLNNQKRLITLPVKKDSDYLDVIERQVSDTWGGDSKKMLNLIKSAYCKSPLFDKVYPIIENTLLCDKNNLFDFLYESITKVNEYLDINTKVVVSSDINIDHSLKSQDKVLAITKASNGKTYINAIGGVDLYDKDTFKANKIQLNFIKSSPIEYKQFKNKFIPWLSIIDVMMFNDKNKIKEYLNTYTLI